MPSNLRNTGGLEHGILGVIALSTALAFVAAVIQLHRRHDRHVFQAINSNKIKKPIAFDILPPLARSCCLARKSIPARIGSGSWIPRRPAASQCSAVNRAIAQVRLGLTLYGSA